jgi:hypothetical protein
VAETLADVRRRDAWKRSDGDELYENMAKRALTAGMEPVTL